MWEVLFGAIATSVGFVISEYIGFLKGRRQAKLDYWREKKDNLDRLLTPDFFDCIIEGSFSSETISNISTTEGSEGVLDIFYEHLDKTENRQFSPEQRSILVDDLRKHILTEKEKCNKEIEKILNSRF